MSRKVGVRRRSDRTPNILGKRVRVWDKGARTWKIATVQAYCVDPVKRLRNGTYDTTERYEVTIEDTKTPRSCSLEDLRPLRGGRWPKVVGAVTATEETRIDQTLDLIGKRVRVWYASARKWKVVTVQHVLFGPAKGVPKGAYFRVTRAGKVNPYYNSLAEIQPLEGKTPALRARSVKRTSPIRQRRKGGYQ